MEVLLFLILECLATFSLGIGQETPACNQRIISNIQRYWKSNGGYPTGIFESYTRHGLQFAYASTLKYFPFDTTCVYFDDYSTNNGMYRSSVHMFYSDRAPTVTDSNVYEENGVTTGDGTLRYHIFVKNGVSCVYTCSNGPDANSDLPHKAGVKMTKSNPDLEPANECISLLNSWGIPINRFYSDFCTANSDAVAPLPPYYGENGNYEAEPLMPPYYGDNGNADVVVPLPPYYGEKRNADVAVPLTQYYGKDIDELDSNTSL